MCVLVCMCTRHMRHLSGVSMRMNACAPVFTCKYTYMYFAYPLTSYGFNMTNVQPGAGLSMSRADRTAQCMVRQSRHTPPRHAYTETQTINCAPKAIVELISRDRWIGKAHGLRHVTAADDLLAKISTTTLSQHGAQARDQLKVTVIFQVLAQPRKYRVVLIRARNEFSVVSTCAPPSSLNRARSSDGLKLYRSWLPMA